MSWVVRNTVLPGSRLLADQLLDAAPAHRVEAARRLVQEQQLGIVEQRPGDAQAALHSLGVLRHPLRAVAARSTRSSSSPASGSALVQGAEVGQVLAAGQLQVVVGKLEGDADVFVVAGCPIRHVLSEHADRAAITEKQTDEDLLGRRLAGAVGAEESENLSTPDAELERLQSGVVGSLVRVAQCGNFDHRVGHLVPSHGSGSSWEPIRTTRG